jgi:hypothetical protein
MGSYGQNIFTGHPTQPADAIGALDRNLRTSTGFGKTGIVVDSYIYDTFEISLGALEALGTSPLTGQMLIDTPSDLMCVVSDFWLYRDINEEEGGSPSSQGTWEENIDLVVYPSTDWTQSVIKTPYEQEYFRVSYQFLSTLATNADGENVPASALYQSNINGGQNGDGAWQIGPTPTASPSGNKVYLSLSSGATTTPSFPTNSATRFYIGIKYRFLMLANGIQGNEDLIFIDAAADITDEYWKCGLAAGEPIQSRSCGRMPDKVYITIDPSNPLNAIIQDANGSTCCYVKNTTSTNTATVGHSIINSFEGCGFELPEECI